jgi:hypothetical protein
MLYDTLNAYDFNPNIPPEDEAHRQERLRQAQELVRAVLPDLRQEIEAPKRDMNSVFEALRPYHHQTGGDVPMTPGDLPELEALYRLMLERGGLEQNRIQTVLLRLIGATAAAESIPFLLEMLHFSRRGDHFGPERRQLALWGLARIAISHHSPEIYESHRMTLWAALRAGLDDHHADVRFTTADLILSAYLDARRKVPRSVVDRLEEMARSDPDNHVRRRCKGFLREPWVDSEIDEAENSG